jgi:hypothetical protein
MSSAGATPKSSDPAQQEPRPKPRPPQRPQLLDPVPKARIIAARPRRSRSPHPHLTPPALELSELSFAARRAAHDVLPRPLRADTPHKPPGQPKVLELMDLIPPPAAAPKTPPRPPPIILRPVSKFFFSRPNLPNLSPCLALPWVSPQPRPPPPPPRPRRLRPVPLPPPPPPPRV